MKKLITLTVLVMCVAVLLTGCFCKHETWNDATCETPKTCAECGETEGEPLGHVWLAATCETPKTCEQCGLTNGEAKGHAWVDATTETPKTCTTCQLTEGDRIITDERFTTAATAEIQGKWGIDIALTAEDLGLKELEEPLTIVFVLELCNDGNLKMYETVTDEDAFWDAIIDIYVEAMYAEFASMGMDQDAADQAMKETYGMGIEEYLANELKGISINDVMAEIMGSANGQGVYYVENGKLYTGFSWEGEFDEDEFTLDGDKLYLDALTDALELEGPFYKITD